MAEKFVLLAVQEWGQSRDDRLKAVQQLLEAAGFAAEATCWPIFGEIWPRPCKGSDGEAATAWLHQVTDTMERGKFEIEVEHVANCIAAAAAR